MTENGFIKLHRKFRDWEWSSNPKMVALFIHLLLSANYELSRFQGHDIPRGSLVAGLFALSEATGISFQSLRTCLEKLKQTGEITVKSTNHFSIISVCNYERYQSREIEINKPITNDQQTDNKRITTSEELKKLRKEERKKEIHICAFIPPSFEEFKSYCTEKGYSDIAAKAFEYYDTSGWKDSKGSQVKNWKQKLIAVWFREDNKDKSKTDSAWDDFNKKDS
jgi:hypothetical protein